MNGLLSSFGTFCCLGIYCLALCRELPADELSDSNAKTNPESKLSDKDRVTIKRSTHPVWFDSKEGTIHPNRAPKNINVDDRLDSIQGPTQPSQPGWWTNLIKDFSDLFWWIFQGWQILILICLIALLSVAFFFLLRNRTSSQMRFKKLSDASQREKEKVKMQDLPFEVEETMFGLLAQAERYRTAGDFSKAIIYLFSYALVEMDAARCIRLERGKTNRVYLRELNDRDSLRRFTHQLVVAFEYAFFGKHVLSKEDFESIWQQLPSFETNLKQILAAPNQSLRATTLRAT